MIWESKIRRIQSVSSIRGQNSLETFFTVHTVLKKFFVRGDQTEDINLEVVNGYNDHWGFIWKFEQKTRVQKTKYL